MEILIVGAIILGVLLYNNVISGKKFFDDNDEYFKLLKEDDYDFYLISKYGDKVDLNERFQKRIKNSILIFVIGLIMQYQIII